MRKLAVAAIFSLAACAHGPRSNEEIRPQYAPVPGQEEGIVLTPPVREVAVAAMPKPKAAVIAMAPEPKKEIKVIVPPKPVRTMEMVMDSVNAAWAMRLASAAQAAARAGEVVGARRQEVVSVTAKRPARPAGMMTAQSVDAALEVESRWQQDVAIATRRVAEAEVAGEDATSFYNGLLAEKAAAVARARYSVESQMATAVNMPVAAGKASTLPVRRK